MPGGIDTGGGGVNAGLDIPIERPKKKGGPFIDWSSAGSILTAGPRALSGLQKQSGELVLGATRGAPALIGSVGSQIAHTPWNLAAAGDSLLDQEYADFFNESGVAPWRAFTGDEEYKKANPFFGPMGESIGRSGTNVQHVARAGGNMLVPEWAPYTEGKPFGESVGELGSGPGLLGNTEYAKAADRGGGGVLPLVVEDIANASLVLGPASALIGKGAKAATATSTAKQSLVKDLTKTHAKAAKAAASTVDDAAKQVVQAEAKLAKVGERVPTAGYDPYVAAEHAQVGQEVRAARESLRQAQEYEARVAAQQADELLPIKAEADTAAQHAAKLQKAADTAELVKNLGIAAGNSPFAPLTGVHLGQGVHVPGLLGAAGKAAEKLAGTPTAQRYISPLISRVEEWAQQSREKGGVHNIIEEGVDKTLTEKTAVHRGQARTAGPLMQDGVRNLDAEAAAIIGQLGENVILRHLVENYGDNGLAMFAQEYPNALTADQLMLAAEAFGSAVDVSPAAQLVRDALPEVKAKYAENTGRIQDENYSGLRGDREAILAEQRPITDGTLDQVQHNLTGTEANIEHLPRTHRLRARTEAIIAGRTREREGAARWLKNAQERAAKTGVTPDDIADPSAFVRRVMEPANGAAADAMARGVDLKAATEPGIRTIGERLGRGTIDGIGAERALASEVLRLAGRGREGLVDLSPTTAPIVAEFLDRLEGPLPRRVMPRIERTLAPAEKIGAGRERVRIGTQDMAVTERRLFSAVDRSNKAYEAMQSAGPQVRAVVERGVRRVVAAEQRVVATLERVRDAQARAEKAGAVDVEAIITDAGVVAAVKSARKASKAFYRDVAASMESHLERYGALKLKWPPPTRRVKRWNAKAKRNEVVTEIIPEWQGQNIERIIDAVTGKSNKKIGKGVAREKRIAAGPKARYFGPDGLAPEDLLRAWHHAIGQADDAGIGGTATHDLDGWFDHIQEIRDMRAKARAATPIEGDVGPVMDWLRDNFGITDAAVAKRIADDLVKGDPETAAALIGPRLREAVPLDEDATGRIAPGGDVFEALERDRQLEMDRGGQPRARDARETLDVPGRALYDQLVAEGQADVQGRVVAQRGTQAVEGAEAVVERARELGQKEGKRLGAADKDFSNAERDWNEASRRVESGQAIIGEAPDLALDAAARTAGPLMKMTGEAAVANKELLNAASNYERVQRSIDRAHENLARSEALLANTVEAAPRPFRPVLRLARDISKSALEDAERLDKEVGRGAGNEFRRMAEEMNLTLGRLVKMGLDPQYVIGTHEQSILTAEVGAKQKSRAGRNLPTAKRTGHRTAGIGAEHDMDYSTMGRRVIARIVRIINVETAQKIQDTYGSTLAAKLEQIDPDRYKQGVIAKMSGEQLIEAMKEHKLVAWEPAAPSKYANRWGNTRAGMESQITPDLNVLPRHLYRHYASYTDAMQAGGGAGTALQVYDRSLRAWKSSVLALSGRWHVGNIAGNAIMAMVGGGIPPHEFVRDALRARRLLRMDFEPSAADLAWLDKTFGPEMRAVLDEGMYAPAPVIGKGWTAGEGLLELMGENDQWVKSPRKVVRDYRAQRAEGAGRYESFMEATPSPIKKSYAFNGVVDDITRVAVFLNKAEKGLTPKGWADFKAAYPELVESGANLNREQAIKLSLRTVGDFTNLSAAEQAIIKRIVPFYPWLRHITKLAGNMAIHDPIRTAWTLHLGNLYADDASGVPWLRTSHALGENRWLRTVAWNPFETVASVSDPDNAFGSFSPFLNVGAAATVGVDIRGRRAVTRPPNTVRSGGLAPLLGDPKALAYYTAGQVPQIAAARESIPAMFGREPVRRYQTGEPIIGGGRFFPSNDLEVPGTRQPIPGGLAPWMGLLGLPRQEVLNDEAIARAEEERKKRERQARNTYEDQRRKANR